MIRCFLFFYLLLLCGCKVGDDYDTKPFINDEKIKDVLHIERKTTKIDELPIFNDKDLNTLLKFALKNNLSRKKAIENLQKARYQLAIQSKQMFPMFNAQGNYSFNKADNAHNFSENVNAFKMGFDVSWEIDIWGKGQYISEQYSEFVKNSGYSLINTDVSLISEIMLNYIKLREAQEKLRITQKNLSLQNEILQTVKNKHVAGTEDDLALNQAQYTVERTRTSIPAMDLQITTYQNNLAVLSGVIPGELPINLDITRNNITTKTFKYNVKKLYNLPLNVIRTRPDVLAAEANVKAQNAAVNTAITNLYPTIDLSAAFGYLSNSGHTLFNTESQVYGYSPSLLLPIWNWNQLANNIEVQKHQREYYLLDYNEIFLTALIELKNAISAVEQTYRRNVHQQITLSKMKNIFNLTQQKYENGLVEFTDVAMAEQNLLDAELALIESNTDILQNLVAFYKAIGGSYN